MPRLDSRQRRVLELLSPTEWRSTDALFAGTTLYRTKGGLGVLLGQFVTRGLVERRVVNRDLGRSEWRLVRGAARS